MRGEIIHVLEHTIEAEVACYEERQTGLAGPYTIPWALSLSGVSFQLAWRSVGFSRKGMETAMKHEMKPFAIILIAAQFKMGFLWAVAFTWDL